MEEKPDKNSNESFCIFIFSFMQMLKERCFADSKELCNVVETRENNYFANSQHLPNDAM